MLQKVCSLTTFRFKTRNATVTKRAQEPKAFPVVRDPGKSPKEY